MNKNKKLLVLPLMLGLLSTSVLVQAETVSQENNALASIEKKDKKGELLPAVLLEKAKNTTASVNREELIAILVHSLEIVPNEKEFSSLPFLDKASVNPDLKGYFASAYKLQMFSGEAGKEGLFSYPLHSVSKEEAAAMIGKALGLRSTASTGYVDESQISAWALPYVSGLKQSALLWDAAESFLPNEPLTWGELTSCLQHARNSQKLILPDIQVLAENRQTSEYESGQTTETEKHPPISQPMGITRDETGTLYIADSGNSMIAALDINGNIKTHAGTMTQRNVYQEALGSYADGSLLKSAFSRPVGVYMAEEGILVADTGNNIIRLLSKDTVFTYAGNKTAGYLDGHRSRALFNAPSAVTCDDSGNLYVSDTLNHCIRKINSKGMVTTIAGTAGTAGFLDGDALTAMLSQPRGLTFKDGALYIADSGNQRIRVYENGTLKTLAGGGDETYEGTEIIVGDYADGLASEARFNDPQGISFGTDSALYIADSGNSMIRKYQNGAVTTLVGVGLPINASENKAANLLCQPVGILALENQIIISDQFTNRILSIPLPQTEGA